MLTSQSIAIILAASITATATIIAGIIGVLRSVHEMKVMNTKDHGAVSEKLDGLKEDVQEIKDDVKFIDSRIDDHVQWHVDNPIRKDHDYH
jgi:hypothetical protein